MNDLALLYQYIGDYESAEPLYKEALQIRKQVLGDQHPDYATSLDNLAVLYHDMGKNTSAEPLLKEAMQIRKQAFGDQDPSYATSLNNLALLYQDIGDYKLAEPLYKEALQIQKTVLGVQHPSYATGLNNLAGLYKALGDYESAEPLYKEALQISKQVLGDQHPDYATSLNCLASLYHDIGNYELSEPLYKEALQIRKQALGVQHPSYAISLNNLALLYNDIGDYASAEPLFKEALQIDKQALGDQHPNYAASLSNLAVLYHDIGDYASAEPLLKEALQIYKQAYGDQHPDYATSLNNLAGSYRAISDYASAEPLLKEALQITKQVFGDQHPSYATSLNNLAVLYYSIGDYASAESLFKEVVQIRKQIFGNQHPIYAVSLHNLSLLYNKTKNYLSAESLEREALQISIQVLGEHHSDYVVQLNSLATLYRDMGDFVSAESLFLSDRLIRTNLIETNFSFMSERQREAFWKRESKCFEVTYLPFIYSYYPQNKAIASFAYDNELFMKGLLLNATQQVQNAVLASGDSVLIDTYNQLRQVKERILYLQQQPLDKQFGLDSLQTTAENLDKQLVLGCKEYRQSQENWKITWKKVREKLTDNDVAIEFSSFHVKEDSTWHEKLVALLLRKDSTVPEYLVIGNEEEISPLLDADAGITYNYADNGAELYAKIWKPLTPYIHEGETVYFAPAGILHQLNISALPVNEKEIIGDKYRLVQLSSTRELAMQRDTYNRDSAVLYGGLVYNVDEDEMQEASAQYAKYDLAATRSLQDNHVRDGVRYLSGTKTEVEQIEMACKQNSVATSTYTSSGGNEESFKALSGLDNNILHIATHGFFFPNEEAKDIQLFMLQGNNQLHERYIDPLLRSGLLLAGANKAWTGHRDQLPEGVQDGILTAKEISMLDLSHADLVVLSACETGKGEITSDGVFGLQRGFKQAGVNSLMMSLWKVDDKATQMLMNEFYRNLLQGCSKIDSLKKAQQYVKSQPGYEDPEFWAGFILLDAIN